MAPGASWQPRLLGRGRRWWTRGAAGRRGGAPRRRRPAAPRARGPRRRPGRPSRRGRRPWCQRGMPQLSSPAGRGGPPASRGPGPRAGPRVRRVGARSRASRCPRPPAAGSHPSPRRGTPSSIAGRRAPRAWWCLAIHRRGRARRAPARAGRRAGIGAPSQPGPQDLCPRHVLASACGCARLGSQASRAGEGANGPWESLPPRGTTAATPHRVCPAASGCGSVACAGPWHHAARRPHPHWPWPTTHAANIREGLTIYARACWPMSACGR